MLSMYHSYTQVNSKTDLALNYNNISVLERQSADFVKKYLEKSKLLESLNIYVGQGFQKKHKIISRISEHIIRTDMIYHFGLIEQISKVIDANQAAQINNDSTFIMNENNTKEKEFQTDSNRDSLDNLFGLEKSKAPLKNSSSYLSLNSLNTIIIPKTVTKEDLMHIILHAAGKSIYLKILTFKRNRYK